MQAGKFTNVSFSARFRALLSNSGKTQKEIATALGLSEGALINYKRDSIPKSNELLSISRYFGVTMEWLLTGEGAENAPAEFAWKQRALAAEQRVAMLKAAVTAALEKF